MKRCECTVIHYGCGRCSRCQGPAEPLHVLTGVGDGAVQAVLPVLARKTRTLVPGSNGDGRVVGMGQDDTSGAKENVCAFFRPVRSVTKSLGPWKSFSAAGGRFAQFR